ncbi:hypothetical protein FD754_007557 [Muntiacus muntjak]|uniref:Receptor expression-enhancing protein n=1 Tax=Muntiacus muntjak TaxID=9888 RepID=A0A5N3WNY9_MUNMU|nr:hypothetical protein FD754_007557 [Muntiacus muntjak]
MWIYSVWSPHFKSWILSSFCQLLIAFLAFIQLKFIPGYVSVEAQKLYSPDVIAENLMECVFFSSLSRFPFYYELKIAFVAWLLSPYTKGSSLLYRKFVHPTLSSKEKGQGALSERLRSFSMQDLSTIRGDGAPAPSGPPPPGPGRASGKHGQPKMSRSASESAGSSVCTCCATCRTRKVVEGDVDEGGVKAWGPHQVQNPLAFSDEEEEDLLDFMYKFKAPRKTEFPLENVLRPVFINRACSSLYLHVTT